MADTDRRADHDARESLLRTAGELFMRQGYAATGVKQLLDESGTVVGSLYHHFPGGKREVAAEVVRREGERIGDRIAADVAALGTRGGIDRTIEILMESMAASDGLEGCPIAMLAVESPIAGRTIRDEAIRQFGSWGTTIQAALVREGHAEDRAAGLAHLLLAAIEGALVLDRTAGTTTALAALRAALPTLVPDAPG
ncbi:TetR/AcrR family transcriptional regulator [Actinomadura rayongensis]|uniref:TetR family transcriptional regulator n=1 Tax=Actinomadura rayongensis TaxID=1429076 RepID=A0A6I4WBH3_9ACTN|nr:TetR/AcrR family transcriptional regulator [Actinomadura rayongensis]MXQ68269.1 TetR family transcriptional regulator [Actinomadura rayongensis]